MINAVIELGDRRVHEVMVPRIAMVAMPATATFDEAIDDDRRARPQPDPGLRRVDRRDHRHPLREGPAAVPDATRPARARTSATLLRTPVFVPGVDDGRRPAPRVPAAEGPHRDRPRRVRRDGRPRHDRGPARGDRRRDPGRVRRRGADGRPAVRRRGAGRRAGGRRRPRATSSTRRSGSRTRTSTTRSAGSSTTASAACPSPGDRVDVDGLTLTVEIDRRPAGRQGARRRASARRRGADAGRRRAPDVAEPDGPHALRASGAPPPLERRPRRPQPVRR